jgi:hypothetical protein
VSVEMKDRDVVERVAQAFRRNVHHRSPRRGREHHSPTYSTAISGRDAVSLMHALYPLMGERRQEQIRRALKRRAEV